MEQLIEMVRKIAEDLGLAVLGVQATSMEAKEATFEFALYRNCCSAEINLLSAIGRGGNNGGKSTLEVVRFVCILVGDDEEHVRSLIKKVFLEALSTMADAIAQDKQRFAT